MSSFIPILISIPFVLFVSHSKVLGFILATDATKDSEEITSDAFQAQHLSVPQQVIDYLELAIPAYIFSSSCRFSLFLYWASL